MISSQIIQLRLFLLQVTAYSHKDENNRWLIKKFDAQAPPLEQEGPVEVVLNGDLVRLEHVM